MQHGVGIPDYVEITRALKEKQYTDRDIEIAEGPAIEMVREVLDRCKLN